MQLDETQKKMIADWADKGLSIAEIQQRINEECNLSLTFMDVRILLLDHGIKLKDRKSASSGSVDLNAAASSQEGVRGQVTVNIDKIKKPGALVNGTVTFSDGVSASWFLDQSGQLGINPDQPGYRPDENDLRAFQEELSRLLQSRGF